MGNHDHETNRSDLFLPLNPCGSLSNWSFLSKLFSCTIAIVSRIVKGRTSTRPERKQKKEKKKLAAREYTRWVLLNVTSTKRWFTIYDSRTLAVLVLFSRFPVQQLRNFFFLFFLIEQMLGHKLVSFAICYLQFQWKRDANDLQMVRSILERLYFSRSRILVVYTMLKKYIFDI